MSSGKRSGSKAVIWKYFEDLQDGNARCKLCLSKGHEVKYKLSGQTRHLASVSVMLFGSCHLILFANSLNQLYSNIALRWKHKIPEEPLGEQAQGGVAGLEGGGDCKEGGQ